MYVYVTIIQCETGVKMKLIIIENVFQHVNRTLPINHRILKFVGSLRPHVLLFVKKERQMRMWQMGVILIL